MITFDKLNRRAHLYLGLFLMPWLMMYGVSSFIVIHQSWFGADKARARALLFEKTYNRPVNMQGANNSPELRATAQEVLKDCDLEGAFWVDRPNADTLHIDRFSFRDGISLTYSIKNQKLKAERRSMRVPQTIMRMHFRGGYQQPTFGNKFWGLLVDTACVGIIIWIASGLIMWWRLPRLRAWGAIAVGGGILSFVLLVWRL
jgi:hypothetical protein